MDQERAGSGTAGNSARREYDRRRSRRHQGIRARHPRIGGAIIALAGEPSHETAWARGADAEAAVAATLAQRCRPDVLILDDRRLPGRRTNIDHLAVAPSGVWVIDTKRYRGKATITRPLLGPARLIIDRRDRTSLIDGLDRQVEAVRATMATLDTRTPIHGALCMVDTDLPLIGTLQLNGYPLLRPRVLAKRLNAPGPLHLTAVRALSSALAARFAPA